MARPSNASSTRRRRRTTQRPQRGAKADQAKDVVRIAVEEEDMCQRVVGHLGKLQPSRPPPRHNDDEALLTLRDQIAAARLEDVPSLMAQMEQVQAIANRRAQRIIEPIDKGCPYFGHLRLEEKERGIRDVLIGKTTYLEPRADIRIVDWRHAPVSQLYYRYDEGSFYEETFGDREVEGTILARRTVTIEDGVLGRVNAPQGTFVREPDGTWARIAEQDVKLAGGEGSALRPEHYAEIAQGEGHARERERGLLGSGGAVGQRENRHLPEISALLDPRQFELISRPDAGLVVIQGGAGSGKTTIGVHRMAFLAFQAPERFAPERMLVVVGTPALRAYIGELLGALGLASLRVATFSEWARRERQRVFPWLRVPLEENTPAVVSRFKADPALLTLLSERARAIVAEGGEADERTALWLWADVLTDKQAVLDAFEARSDTTLTRDEVKRAWRYCSDRCPMVVDWCLEAVDEETGERIDEEAYEEPDDRLALDPEDDALLLRAYQVLCNPLLGRRAGYEHLFVDETQDLAPVDLAVLVDVVGKAKSITLAGDLGQRLRVDSGFSDWGTVLDDLELSHVDVEPLKIAYRSTRQVLAFALDVLGPLADSDPPVAPRSGAPVEHHHFPGPGAAVAFLANALRPLFIAEPRATVALLARYPEQADAYYDALKTADIPLLRRVRNYDFSFRPGVELTEVRQVKGLEYDYVILVDVNTSSYPDDEEARYQLHIGATRAAHQLWVISTGPPSKLIPSWLNQS